MPRLVTEGPYGCSKGGTVNESPTYTLNAKVLDIGSMHRIDSGQISKLTGSFVATSTATSISIVGRQIFYNALHYWLGRCQRDRSFTFRCSASAALPLLVGELGLLGGLGWRTWKTN